MWGGGRPYRPPLATSLTIITNLYRLNVSKNPHCKHNDQNPIIWVVLIDVIKLIFLMKNLPLWIHPKGLELSWLLILLRTLEIDSLCVLIVHTLYVGFEFPGSKFMIDGRCWVSHELRKPLLDLVRCSSNKTRQKSLLGRKSVFICDENNGLLFFSNKI